MHFRHQWAGGIEDTQPPRRRLLLHRTRDTVSAEDDDAIVGHFGQFIDKDGATLTQILDDEAIVHDFMAYIDGRTEDLEGAIDDLDGAIDASTKSTRIGEQNAHYTPSGHCTAWASAARTRRMSTSNTTSRPARGWLKSTSTSSPITARTTPGSSVRP